MGVKHLWEILQLGGESTALEILKGRVVAIDASIWIMQAVASHDHSDERNANRKSHFLYQVIKRLVALLEAGALPLFVFDGPPPQEKVAEVKRRHAARLDLQKGAKLLAKRQLAKLAKVDETAKNFRAVRGGKEKEINQKGQETLWNLWDQKGSGDMKSQEDLEDLGYLENLGDLKDLEELLEGPEETVRSHEKAVLSEFFAKLEKEGHFRAEELEILRRGESLPEVLRLLDQLCLPGETEGLEGVEESSRRTLDAQLRRCELVSGLKALHNSLKEKFASELVGGPAGFVVFEGDGRTAALRRNDDSAFESAMRLPRPPKFPFRKAKKFDFKEVVSRFHSLDDSLPSCGTRQFITPSTTDSKLELKDPLRREKAFDEMFVEAMCGGSRNPFESLDGPEWQIESANMTEKLDWLGKDSEEKSKWEDPEKVMNDKKIIEAEDLEEDLEEDEEEDLEEISEEEKSDEEQKGLGVRRNKRPYARKKTVKRIRSLPKKTKVNNDPSMRETFINPEDSEFGVVEEDIAQFLFLSDSTPSSNNFIPNPRYFTPSSTSATHPSAIPSDGMFLVRAQTSSLIQRLLSAMGIPFIQSASEAEAECARLEALGAVDMTLTEDSDFFLFGGRRAVRGFCDFLAGRGPLEYFDMEKILSRIGLDREKLVWLGLLLGCDYAPGVRGVGAVNAMEIVASLKEFEDLKELASWADNLGAEPPEAFRNLGDTHGQHRVSWVFPKGFPSKEVRKLFLEPKVGGEIVQRPVAKEADFTAVEELIEAAGLSEVARPLVEKMRRVLVHPQQDSICDLLKINARPYLKDPPRLMAPRVTENQPRLLAVPTSQRLKRAIACLLEQNSPDKEKAATNP